MFDEFLPEAYWCRNFPWALGIGRGCMMGVCKHAVLDSVGSLLLQVTSC